MPAGLSRDEFIELRRAGIPDSYPKPTQAAVQELQDRGYAVDITVLNYLVKTGKVKPGRVGQRNLCWQSEQIEVVAGVLEDQEAFVPAVVAARFHGFAFADYLRALKLAVSELRQESGDEQVGEDPTLFIMHVHPPRFGRSAKVSFSLCDDVREHLCPVRAPVAASPEPVSAQGGRVTGKRKPDKVDEPGALPGGAASGTLNHRNRNGMAFSAD